MIIAASGSEVNPTELPRCDRVGYRVLDHRDGHPFPVADPRGSRSCWTISSDAALLKTVVAWPGRLAGAAARLALAATL